MITPSFSSPAALALALLVVASPQLASAHMMMSSPAPRQSVANPGPGGAIDYSYTAPLASAASFPCKGYPAQAPVLTVAAGSSIPVQVTGGANHGGGHCQFAISYDNDRTWVVLDTVIRSCLQAGAQSFSVPLPASAPSGKASFAWTWINAVGNREYYMGCSDIQVTGGGSGLTGPALLVANIGDNPTIPEFGSASLPDMHELFNTRPIITVTGTGAASSSPATAPAMPPPAAPATPSPAAPVTPSPAAPVTPPPAAPAPVVVPLPSQRAPGPRAACSNGQFKCDGADKWALCTPARAWVSQPAPPGTRCRDDEGAVYFERA